MLLQRTIPPEKPPAVQLKTILNHVERHKSFVYQEARWADPEAKTEIEIRIEPRANGRAICSGCGQQAPGYDRLAEATRGSNLLMLDKHRRVSPSANSQRSRLGENASVSSSKS